MSPLWLATATVALTVMHCSLQHAWADNTAPDAVDGGEESPEVTESESLPPVAAIVLGTPIRSQDADAVQSEVLTRLFEDYADTKGLSATKEEVAAYLDKLHEGKRKLGLTAADDLTPAEAAELAEMEHGMARAMVERWKINRSLYEHYGGRIIFQQFGLEPLDAYRSYLEERREAGDLSFQDDAMSEHFWRYFRDESIHSFVAPDSAEARKAFSVPPWEEVP